VGASSIDGKGVCLRSAQLYIAPRVQGRYKAAKASLDAGRPYPKLAIVDLSVTN